MPELMRRDVRLLGELLGRVLTESGGQDLLRDVARLRRAVIAARDSAAHERVAFRLGSEWPRSRAEEVARAFTCCFHLANLAEEHQRARMLRERTREPSPLRDSLAAAVTAVRDEQGDERLRALLAGLHLCPVLTAHPTETRRRAVVTAIRRIGEHLERLDDPRRTPSEEREVRRRLLEEIDVLWRTAQLRSTQLHPLEEVRAALAVFDGTLLKVVPEIYRELDNVLGPDDAGRRPPLAPAFLRFGTWVGGDRDGNPFVTAEVTARAVRIQSEQVLGALEAAVARAGRMLTVDHETTPPSADLARRLAQAPAATTERLVEVAARSAGEPHREFLLYVAERIGATRRDAPVGAYA